jgi:hypothetical protein
LPHGVVNSSVGGTEAGGDGTKGDPAHLLKTLSLLRPPPNSGISAWAVPNSPNEPRSLEFPTEVWDYDEKFEAVPAIESTWLPPERPRSKPHNSTGTPKLPMLKLENICDPALVIDPPACAGDRRNRDSYMPVLAAIPLNYQSSSRNPGVRNPMFPVVANISVRGAEAGSTGAKGEPAPLSKTSNLTRPSLNSGIGTSAVPNPPNEPRSPAFLEDIWDRDEEFEVVSAIEAS